MPRINCIGILTSGGDAPGMNAAIRAITRSAICRNFTVKGIYRGYDGLVNDEIKEFTTESVSNIIAKGGTILKSARSKAFMTPEGRKQAYEVMQQEKVEEIKINSDDMKLHIRRKNYSRPVQRVAQPTTQNIQQEKIK